MKIMLSYGGGGRKTQELIKKIFLKHLDNEFLHPLDDGAIIDKLVFSTDSYVVQPIIFPGGDIGKLAVSGTINDISVMGAKPMYLSLGLIIEEGLEKDILEKIVKSISETAEEAGVKIITGDTKVVEEGKGDSIYINTSGIGNLLVHPPPSVDRIEVGDKIIINGEIGMHGIAVLVARKQLGIKAEVKTDCAPLSSLISSVISPSIKFMRDPTRGGLAASFNEVVEGKDWGIELYEDKIPISDEVKGVCELLGYDPLNVANEGKVISIVERSAASDILKKMRKHPSGKNSEIIGEITDRYPKRVILHSNFGTKRIVEMPTGTLLPRIC